MFNKIKSKKVNRYFIISFFIISSLLSIILIYQINDLEIYKWTKVFSYVLLVNFCIQLLVLKSIGIKLFSLTGLFIGLSYLFHYGQILIMGLFPNYEFEIFNYIKFYDIMLIKEAAIYSFIVIIMVNIGIIISHMLSKDSKSINKMENVINSTYRCKKIGWILIVLLFPLELYIKITKIVISFSQGYLSTYGIGLPGFVGAIASLSYMGFALILLGYSENKKMSFYILSFLISYFFITMLSGHRGHQLTMILFYLYIYMNYINKVKFKKIIIILILSYVAIALLNSIADFRRLFNKDIGKLIGIFLKNLKGDSIKNLITELGGTIKTLYLTLKQIPYNKPHTWGSNYFLGFFSIFPDVGDIFSDINSNAKFTKNLVGHALGGSYIAELYYNFSYYGVIFAIFIGIFINHISQKIDRLLNTKNYLKAIYYFPLFQYILWWVRGTFPAMLRPFFWGVITLYLFEQVFNFNKSS